MTQPHEWGRIKALFSAALEVPSHTRAAWIAAHCGDDEALRAELESLLESHDHPHRVFEDSPMVESDVHAEVEDDLPAGYRIGPYRIDRLIGRGGMGAVYHATR